MGVTRRQYFVSVVTDPLPKPTVRAIADPCYARGVDHAAQAVWNPAKHTGVNYCERYRDLELRLSH